jgi:hypothetical protein
MQHTCFAQRSSPLRTEYKRGLSLRTLQEAFEHQQSLPTFRIREENCPIGRYVLTRPNNVRPFKPGFRDGEIVHNRFANEDGKVMGSYDKEGVCMYAVSVLFIPPPREHAPYSSDWAEDCLEPSDKTKFLRSPDHHFKMGDAFNR